MVNDFERYQDLVKEVLNIYEKGLKKNKFYRSSFRIGEDSLTTRKDAESMIQILKKIQNLKTMEELESFVKKEYNNIPYIIGLTPNDTILWPFQETIEKIKESEK